MNNRNRVLLVDDDPMIRKSLGRILRMNNYETIEASDGMQAVEMVQEARPDLLVLDIRMPGIDGVETFQQIRQLWPGIPAIFMTAYAASDRAVAASTSGGLCVLMKPLDVSALLEVIDNAVQEAPVLIVDDQEGFRTSLARALESAGIANTTAKTLEEAVEHLRMRPRCVVIADVYLQDGNGLELLGEVDSESGSPPLVLVTGHPEWLGGDERSAQLGQLGVQCIEKPLDIPKLISAIDALRKNVG